MGNDNAPLRGYKSGVYEGGIRTPGLACWPGKLPLARCTRRCTPSIGCRRCATCRRKADRRSEMGRHRTSGPCSREPAKTLPDPDALHGRAGFARRTVRHGDWKLVVTPADGKKAKAAQEELFNLADDLSESKNLAAERPEKVAEMKQRLAEISRRDRDAVAKD